LVARNPYAAPYPSKAIVTLLSVPLNDAVNSSATIKPFWHKHTLTLLEYGKLLYSMPLPRAGAATPTSARQTANGSFLLAIGFPVLAPRARGKHIPLKPIAGTVARKPDYRRFRTASAVNSFLYFSLVWKLRGFRRFPENAEAQQLTMITPTVSKDSRFV
jgi:hypothetical protein